jgi:hypothetical protein
MGTVLSIIKAIRIKLKTKCSCCDKSHCICEANIGSPIPPTELSSLKTPSPVLKK